MTGPAKAVRRRGATARRTVAVTSGPDDRTGVPGCVHPASRVLAAGLLVLATGGCAEAPRAEAGLPPLHYVASAEQVGPVAYRDPLGVVSPDGRWLAYTERDRLHLVPVAGGATRVLGSGASSMRFIAWLADSRRVAVRERVFDRSRQEWWLYDRTDGGREPLWPGRDQAPDLTALDMLAWSPDGTTVAGVSSGGGESIVWLLDADGANPRPAATGTRLSFPAWSPDGQLACLSFEDGHQRLQLPCDAPGPLFTDQEVYGPLAFSPAGDQVYYAAPGEGGFLDLWARPAAGGAPTRLTGFARDAYAPTAGADGRILFKSQDYRVFVATAPAAGGPSTPLTTFQSETPTWSWDGSEVAFTFGSWRHVTDDFHYPDIAQHIGIVGAGAREPHDAPERVVRQSYSEDQGMHTSPNGRWIAFHTHEESDDIWLMPADGSGEARMISEDGHETGWARWSADGRWILFPSYRVDDAGARRAHLFVIGIDQATGQVTEHQARIELVGFEQDVIQGEWADAGETVIFEAAEAVGRKSLWRVPRTGGTPERLHNYGSDQIHSGIGVSADGRWVAYVDRAGDGFFQIFRVPAGGGAAEQLTFDPSHKTQPAYSPAGDRIAFTVFDYRVHFWRIEAGF